MPTPIFICGAECAVNFVGTTSPATEHWSVVTGPPTVDTTTFNSAQGGVCSFRCNPTAATRVLRHAFASGVASPATVVARFYIYFTSVPNGDCQLFATNNDAAAGPFFKSSDSKIYAHTSAGVGASGVTVTTGQWYRIDTKIVLATAQTCDVQVNGSACGQATATVADFAAASFDIGVLTARTADLYYDDIIVSGTSGDYPIGAGGVVGLYPSGDGSHNYSAATDFLDGGTAQASLNATASLEVDTWLSLRSKADGGLSSTVDNSNFVTNATGATTEYLRWNFEDLPATVATVNGFASVSTHHAASATGNTQSMKLEITGVNVFTILGGFSGNTATSGVDLSDTTIICVYVCRSDAVSVADINAMFVHWSSTDVTPDAYIDGICLECSVTFTTFDGGPHVIVAPSQAAQTASRW